MPKINGKLCFVIMPFSEDFQNVYWEAIKPACNKAGFEALRVDELEGVYNINQKIIEHIFDSDAIIADLTNWRPNVFYELGIEYEQTATGLAKLSSSLVTSLASLEAWRRHPTNPVQQFKPHDAFIPINALTEIRQELHKKDELLKASVSKGEWEKLQRELHAKEKLLSESVPKSDFEALQKQLAQKVSENAALVRELDRMRLQSAAPRPSPSAKSLPTLQLRSKPNDTLSDETVKAMIEKYDFYCAEHKWSEDWSHPQGKGINHEYEVQLQGKVVIDHTTGLMWQQSGSPETMTYENAKAYVAQLNKDCFAGFGDWRLPTLEEALSLMEPQKNSDGSYINSKFDKTQSWIWTADMYSASAAWVVYFYNGLCYRFVVDIINNGHVRVVRSGQ
ncbi:DUF1566 domain-containing protein [candidate division KSB1 bacterium]|nr:DUF1566 domain-containing protein [candidate division KSB1 bacterium]